MPMQHMPTLEKTLTLVASIEPVAVDFLEHDPLDAITGVVWGSLLGGAFWLTLLVLVLTG